MYLVEKEIEKLYLIDSYDFYIRYIFKFSEGQSEKYFVHEGVNNYFLCPNLEKRVAICQKCKINFSLSFWV